MADIAPPQRFRREDVAAHEPLTPPTLVTAADYAKAAFDADPMIGLVEIRVPSPGYVKVTISGGGDIGLVREALEGAPRYRGARVDVFGSYYLCFQGGHD